MIIQNSVFGKKNTDLVGCSNIVYPLQHNSLKKEHKVIVKCQMNIPEWTPLYSVNFNILNICLNKTFKERIAFTATSNMQCFVTAYLLFSYDI